MNFQLNSTLSHSFNVVVGNDIFNAAATSHLSRLDNRRTLVVTTPTVDRLHGQKLRQCLSLRPVESAYVVLNLREEHKTLESVERVCELAMQHNIGRKDVLIAFGGGVCSDVVGFAASMLRRGISHVRVPTTLIGQIDAGIGLKGGVNHRNKKNILGCFHPPEAVFVDPAFLATLPACLVLQGIAEITKVALVSDGHLYEKVAASAAELIESRFQSPPETAFAIVAQAIRRTLAELRENPFEDQTLERRLDFGHTFSPSLEEESDFRIPHGEAVAIDMSFTCALAVELGILHSDLFDRIVTQLRSVGLPVWSPLLTIDLCNAAIRHVTSHRGGSLNLVVPTEIGKARFIRSRDSISTAVMEKGLQRLAETNVRKVQIAAAPAAGG